MVHKHNFKALYYRKKRKNKSQDWIKVSNKLICDKCLKIVKLR